MKKYIEDKKCVEVNFQYPDMESAYFKDLSHFANISISENILEIDKVKIISGYVHNLFSHNGDNVPSLMDPVTIINEARQGKSFRCVEYSYLAQALVLANGIVARIIGLKTKDVEIRLSGAGHVVLEFWSKDFLKWVMVDVQEGVIPVSNGVPLSCFEFANRIENGKDFEFNNVTDSKFNIEKDSNEYADWVKQYLYYFDTGVEVFSINITDQDRFTKQKIMLIPIDEIGPKIFQNKIPIINTIYTNSLLDFYPNL